MESVMLLQAGNVARMRRGVLVGNLEKCDLSKPRTRWEHEDDDRETSCEHGMWMELA
jgi:hypothetical protein